ncbi:408_t:CDS:2 [Dentiscutata heterogama]|uniref:408_t:CDS:1 n=1 Tax=Dentiscutata heterogama TaxID=1316150 RepID=A0ACA9NLV9_9GLOM|nr:408_t:CDS:2 [Dentiscutata heterogama]
MASSSAILMTVTNTQQKTILYIPLPNDTIVQKDQISSGETEAVAVLI